MNKEILAVMNALGEILLQRDLEISALNYENEQLKKKIETIEKYCEQLQEEQL